MYKESDYGRDSVGKSNNDNLDGHHMNKPHARLDMRSRKKKEIGGRRRGAPTTSNTHTLAPPSSFSPLLSRLSSIRPPGTPRRRNGGTTLRVIDGDASQKKAQNR